MKSEMEKKLRLENKKDGSGKVKVSIVHEKLSEKGPEDKKAHTYEMMGVYTPKYILQKFRPNLSASQMKKMKGMLKIEM